MRDFKNLAVWSKAHVLVLAVYQATNAMPVSELFGLTSQLRRAAVSIPTNIAEGCGRDGDAERVRFLRIAMGSGNEVEYLLLASRDLGYLTDDQFEPLNAQVLGVKRMLSGFICRVSPRSLRLEA